MKKIDIDLDTLSDETLASIAFESDDTEVLYMLYIIGVERNCKDILIGILRNCRIETKETVGLIEQYSRNTYEIEESDGNKVSDKYDEVIYDKRLKEYLAVNPYTSKDTLTDMLVWGELTPILNTSMPNDILNKYMVSSSSLPLIQNNPELIEKLVTTLSYKLSDETLMYLGKVPFEISGSEVNQLATQALERRVAFRAGLQKVKN